MHIYSGIVKNRLEIVKIKKKVDYLSPKINTEYPSPKVLKPADESVVRKSED